MAKFRHKNGGIAEVFTEVNIKRLRASKDYVEVLEKAPKKVKKTPKATEEVVEDMPLQ